MATTRALSALGGHLFPRVRGGGHKVLLSQARSLSAASAKPDMTLIRELREASGAPVVDCKNALAAEGVNGDISLAFEWLRRRGIAKATAMADRSANEGLIGLKLEGPRGALVEVNSETDFVARNSKFQEFVEKTLSVALQEAERGDQADAGKAPGVRVLDVDQLLQEKPPGSPELLKDSLSALIGVIRENITLTRAQVVSLEGKGGVVSGYVHAAVGPGMGKTAALVALAPESGAELGEDSQESLRASGRCLAMHVVAARPAFLDEASAPPGALEREKNLLLEQARETGKDPKFLGKMVDGRYLWPSNILDNNYCIGRDLLGIPLERVADLNINRYSCYHLSKTLRKYLAENALVNQGHVVEEGNPRVADHLASLGEKLGAKVSVEAFARLTVGERTASSND